MVGVSNIFPLGFAGWQFCPLQGTGERGQGNEGMHFDFCYTVHPNQQKECSLTWTLAMPIPPTQLSG